MNTYIFNQFRGLGDILFLVPIARKYIQDGHNVIMPVIPEFVSIKKHFQDLSIVDKSTIKINYDNKNFIDENGYKVIPFRFANEVLHLPYVYCMAAKYKLVGLDVSLWRTLKWERDIETENRIFYDILKLNDNEPYMLINKTFLSTNNGLCKDINIPRNIRTVDMSILNNSTLLDWSKVIENASCIHTVSTSILYMLDTMELKAQDVHIYKRKPYEDNHGYYDYLMNKNYIYHD